MSASLCYWLGISCGAIAFVVGVMWLLIRFSCVQDPSEEYAVARLQEWTVDDRELPDFDWRLAR